MPKMNDPFAQVGEFHQTFGRAPDPIAMVNGLPEDRIKLREDLVLEELKELREAIELGDRAKILQEISDLHYVVIGYYLTLGISPELARAAFNEVHEANMSKLMPDGSVRRREDGKVLKGPNYRLPDLHGVLARFYGQS